MVDRYTKTVLTVIAAALVGLLVRPLLETTPAGAQQQQQAPRPQQEAQQPTPQPQFFCGTPDAPCFVSLVGGPPSGTWQGAPIAVYDAQADARAQAAAQRLCGGAGLPPCATMIIGGPDGLGAWRGVPLVVIDAQRIVPRTP